MEESPSEIEQPADNSDLAGSVLSLVPETPEEELSVVQKPNCGNAGTHIFNDRIKVTIKCIPKCRVDRYLDVVIWQNVQIIARVANIKLQCPSAHLLI